MSQILYSLPGYDCGLCDPPSCGALARDVAAGQATGTGGVLLFRRRLEELRPHHPRST